jgi:hypothetical protein
VPASCCALTGDHLWDHPELKNVLSRAVGLDAHLLLDFAEGETEEGDRFVLLSDGVWGVLPEETLVDTLLAHPDAQQAAAALTSLALAQGGQDNASAVVLEALTLPPPNLRDSRGKQCPPAFAATPQAGAGTGRAGSRRVVHDSRITLLYRVATRRAASAWCSRPCARSAMATTSSSPG